MEGFRYLSDVTTIALDPDACIGCGVCEVVCPHGVPRLDNGKARIIDRDACIECGACARNCPVGAVTVEPGVGCAAYIIQCWLKGKEHATCGGPSCC